MLLVVENELTLIDTGYRGSSPEIENCLNQLGHSASEISLIILTHNHIDHAGGLAELKPLTRARVAIHKADIVERRHLPLARPEDIDTRLEGGEVFDPLGGLEIIYTPGHTQGSISLFSQKNKLLIAGDAVRKRRDILDLPYRTTLFDLGLAIESIKKMASLDLNVLCFGHGLPLSDGVQLKLQDLITRNGY